MGRVIENGRFVLKEMMRVESVPYPQTADGHPSMFLPLGFIWAHNSVWGEGEGGSCLLSLSRPLWRNLEARARRADSLSRPSFLSCTRRWRIILFFSRLKKLERSRDYLSAGRACQLSRFILGPLPRRPKTYSKIPSLQTNSSP